jgi:polyisoprenoid-binding protein YceI
MKKIFASPALTAAALVAAFATAPVLAADYVQAPGSTLTFTSSYDGESFTGKFGSFATTFNFDPANLATAKLDVNIALTGTASGNADRDSTLVGNDFFNIAKFAQAHYSASKFRALGNNQFAADGNLTLRGVSKPVTLTFTWTPGAQPMLTGKATVKRLDFNIGAGDWADTKTLPNEVVVNTKVVFKAK